MADSTFTSVFSKRLAAFPGDLVAILVVLCAAVAAIFLPGVRETPIRFLLGVPLVLFVPGYVVVAALFPARASSTIDRRWPTDGLDGIARIGLSLGLSIIIVPLLALLVNFSPLSLTLEPIVAGLAAFTLLGTFVAAARRLALPSADRFRVPYQEWFAAAQRRGTSDGSRSALAVKAFLVVSVVLAVGSVGYAVGVPQQGEQFTEFYLLSENESGEFVAENFTGNLSVGERQPVTVGVTNYEHEPMSYSVVAQLQRVNSTGEGITVQQRESLGQLQTGEIAAGEQWRSELALEPSMTGDEQRLLFLLYRGDPPANPTADTAYQRMHLWVNVSDS
jgi:uncharacterized membrane protein